MHEHNIIVATGLYTYDSVPFFFHHRGPALNEALGTVTIEQLRLLVHKTAWLPDTMGHKGTGSRSLPSRPRYRGPPRTSSTARSRYTAGSGCPATCRSRSSMPPAARSGSPTR